MNDRDALISRQLLAGADVLSKTAGMRVEVINKAAGLIQDCLMSGGKVLVCGNGGSAADAQHFVAELIGRFMRERKALAAVALTTDSSILTALGNDYGFEKVFTRQLEALGEPGDVLIVLSTSGISPNVVAAVATARQMGLHTVGLIGGHTGPLVEMVEICIAIPSEFTPLIQQAHMAVLHIICELVESTIIQNNTAM